MPSITESLGDWTSHAHRVLAQLPLRARADDIGRVEAYADGVVALSGLVHAQLGERLLLQGGRSAYVLSLEPQRVHCVLLDAAPDLEIGSWARRSGEPVSVPVGPALLGRVIDPLGRPLDGGEAPAATERLPVERAAPEIIDRDLVSEPVHTGVLAIDALFALGRGQRELIIGDGATGKTTLATDAMISQKHSDMICVYVAVGQKSTSTTRVIEAVTRHGEPQRCVFVVAGPADPPGLQWIAPFAGMSIAEWFRDRGQHALLVIDDLSKHAATHRELALLTHQPPGREAYPGDVFYVHARLLERAAKLSAARGGGSLTALPIAETEAGNLSAYIPTNLISIADGQIVLGARLFQSGYKPAVDTGLSVSRVGGKTQTPSLRAAAGSLRLDYAQFLELEAFTRFGAALDARLGARILRGERMRAVLAQPQYAPLRPDEEVALLLALRHGALDALTPAQLATLRRALPGWLERDGVALMLAARDDAGRKAVADAVAALGGPPATGAMT